ncbi:ABC transporter substrate-binding protein [Paenibacillus ginsengarvi]|uniref:Extracellular solute-binding protein n=1 Tax=Paenibacillus ginsengarvi TaxID=400777 RepID=A0A3B0C280_9BACL|nr:extracellular solute-binding protein [Paenibacillus ginsengarvi]RKN80435.1 extracellular solute-binding protein [Paenibacillus ginsengarvi]
MPNEKRNKVRLLTALMLLSVPLAACGTGSVSNSGEKSQTPSVSANKDWTKESFKVVFFANNTQKQEEIDFWFGNPLRKKFPNIEFVWQPSTPGYTLPELVATGGQIDVFFTTRGNFETLAYGHDIQYDMTELAKLHDVDLSRIEPILLDEVKRTSGGKLYMLPVQNNIQLLFYNKDIFDKFGVTYPKDGMTWDEVLALGSKMTRKDGDKLYFGFSNQGAGQVIKMNPMSLVKVDPETGKVQVNKDPKWASLFETFFVRPYPPNAVFQEFFAKNSAPPGILQFYKEQNTAMTTYIASLLGQQYMDLYLGDLNWDIVSHPTISGYPGLGTQPDPIYIGMTKLTKNKEATMEVIKYLVSDEYQTMMARQANMTVLKDPAIQKQTGADIQRSGVGKNWGALYANKMAPLAPIHPKVDLLVVTELSKYANQVSKGELDLNTALRTAEEVIQKKIDEELAKGK